MFAALKRIGWRHDRTVGSHKILKKEGWADFAKISKKTGLHPPDAQRKAWEEIGILRRYQR